GRTPRHSGCRRGDLDRSPPMRRERKEHLMTSGIVLDTPLVLAVPSKGRLQQNASDFFARAGLNVLQGRGARDYRGTLSGMDGVEIAFLSTSEIVAQLAAGALHMGVTGE